MNVLLRCLCFLRRSAVIITLFICSSISAQHLSQISGIEVDRGSSPLYNAWTGGFNNPVISPIDLNQDGLMDLLIYDKSGLKLMCFINTGSVGQPSYRYAPEYDVFFPKGLADWAVVRDYDKDGVPDIFALVGNVNVEVYHGSRLPGGGLSFTKIKDRLIYKYGASGIDGVYAMLDDLPIFMDMDHDGDMDIMGLESTGTRLCLYQNMSQEMGYGNDSLIYNLTNGCWGNIWAGGGCSVTYFSCKDGNPTQPLSTGQRDFGGTVYGFDYQNDHDVDILLADLSCNSLQFFENDGDSVTPSIGPVDTLFPSYDRSVKMATFPAAYGVDADNDGYQDLLVSPFSTNNYYVEKSQDVRCIQFYQNDGAAPPLNRFHYLGDTLLTPTTIDVGTESHSVFFDYNGDGLMDIVVGNFGRFGGRPSLALYVNTGTDTMPRFSELSTDWSGISRFNLSGVFPAFGDMDGDGHPDMVIGDQMGHIHLFRNTGIDTATYPSMTQSNWFGIDAGSGAAPFIYDLNGDSLNDLIIGTTDNYIHYYWNYGTRTVPLFSADSVNSFLGHITTSGTQPVSVEYRSPMIYQEGNQLYLYTGSREGCIEKYLVDKDSLRHGVFTQVSHDVIGTNPGLHSTVSIADINHDGHNDYLLGNVRGGLMIFSDAYWGNGISLPTAVIDVPHSDDRIQIYPVPARDLIQCRLALGTGRLLSAQLYNLLGAVVSAPVTEDSDGLTLSLTSVPAGIYVIQISDDQGKTYQQKVSVMK